MSAPTWRIVAMRGGSGTLTHGVIAVEFRALGGEWA